MSTLAGEEFIRKAIVKYFTMHALIINTIHDANRDSLASFFEAEDSYEKPKLRSF